MPVKTPIRKSLATDSKHFAQALFICSVVIEEGLSSVASLTDLCLKIRNDIQVQNTTFNSKAPRLGPLVAWVLARAKRTAHYLKSTVRFLHLLPVSYKTDFKARLHFFFLLYLCYLHHLCFMFNHLLFSFVFSFTHYSLPLFL